MLTKNIQTLFSTICFSLLNVLFLMQHFSEWGCLCVVITIAFYFFRINYLGNKNSNGSLKGISEWIGIYLGAFALDVFAILACKLHVFAMEPIPGGSSGSVLWAICLFIGEIIALRIISKKATPERNLYFYLRYIILFAVTIWISYIFIHWENASVIALVSTIVILALIIDCLSKGNTENVSSYGFTWASIVLMVFNALNCWYGQFSLYIVDLVYNFRVYDFTPWYINAIAILLLVICAINSFLLKETRKSTSFDVRIFISMIASIIMLWMLSSVSTEYDGAFLVIMVVVNFAFLLCRHNERDVTVFDFDCSVVTLKYICMLVMSILLPVSLYFGWLYQYICICITIIGMYVFSAIYAVKGNNSIPLHKTWMFWQFIVTMAAVYACVIAYFKSNFTGNYIVIGFTYILVTFAFAIINYENKLKKNNHSIMRIIIAVSAMVFLFFSSNQSNVAVTFDVDNNISAMQGVNAESVGETGRIQIQVKTKDDKQLDVFYYWADASEQITELDVKTNSTNDIEFRNGCLNIVCEDENGVVSTAKRWFYNEHLVERRPVGICKNIYDLLPEEVPTE